MRNTHKVPSEISQAVIVACTSVKDDERGG
jgi:hypothetical protein